jgi:hypothetical protein
MDAASKRPGSITFLLAGFVLLVTLAGLFAAFAWDYQLTVFVFLELPWRLLGLGIAIGVLFLFFRRPRTKDRLVET